MKALIALVGLLALAPALPLHAADDLPTATITPPPDALPRPVVSRTISENPDASSSFIGTIVPHVETDLGFPLIGTIAERSVDVGDQVARGDVLARLDPQDLNADLRTAQAGVSVARSQLNQARDADDRARELVQRGVETDTRLEAADRALKAAEARLEQAQASLARATDARSYADLTAPDDGIITEVFAEPGATVSTGDPVLRLVGTQKREIIFDVSEPDLAALDIDSAFEAALISNPAITTRVTLLRVDPVANRTTRTRRVHMALDDPPTGFRLGALVRLLPSTITTTTLHLPQSALLPGPDGQAQVWVVDRTDNTVRRTPVVPGETFGANIRIQSGLSVGDEVVLKGIHSLTDGQTVGPQVPE